MPDMPSLSISSAFKLPSGRTIPKLGLGVFQATSNDCERAISDALKAGYRHIDSAQYYQNEKAVGNALTSSSISRSEIFVTTKYMPTGRSLSPDAVYDKLKPSLNLIDGKEGGYIDLFLIHSPGGGPKGRAANWEALVRAQKEGWVKDIGVSNFGVAHLKSLPSPKPAINQIEIHPWCQQKEIVSYCKENNIILQAYCPLVRADPQRFADPVIKKLGEKHGKNAAQILIRWSLQMGFVPLPKSVNQERIKSNADVYDFNLDEGDMKALEGLDEGAKGACSWNPVNDP